MCRSSVACLAGYGEAAGNEASPPLRATGVCNNPTLQYLIDPNAVVAPASSPGGDGGSRGRTRGAARPSAAAAAAPMVLNKQQMENSIDRMFDGEGVGRGNMTRQEHVWLKLQRTSWVLWDTCSGSVSLTCGDSSLLSSSCPNVPRVATIPTAAHHRPVVQSWWRDRAPACASMPILR